MTLNVIDHDVVEESNLQRQVIHSHSSLGMFKAESAEKAIKDLNDSVDVRVYRYALDPSNALGIISTFDLVLDASDNPGTRYLINDSCVLTKTPLVSASALRMEGQLTTYVYKNGPCYRWYVFDSLTFKRISDCTRECSELQRWWDSRSYHGNNGLSSSSRSY